MHIKPLPSAEFIRSVLDYNPETGLFYWKPREKNQAFTTQYGGRLAGNTPNHNGYFQIRINNKLYMCHRLAWLWVHGVDPGQLEVDHINGVAGDNRLCNLRLATRAQNNCNMGRKRSVKGKLNPSPYKGVTQLPSGRWQVMVGFNRKYTYVGSFDTVEQARVARNAAAVEMHGEFARIV